MELQFIFGETNYNSLPCCSKSHHERSTRPSDMVLRLIVGMAFFRNEPIAEVALRMNVCADGLADECDPLFKWTFWNSILVQ